MHQSQIFYIQSMALWWLLDEEGKAGPRAQFENTARFVAYLNGHFEIAKLIVGKMTTF